MVKGLKQMQKREKTRKKKNIEKYLIELVV